MGRELIERAESLVPTLRARAEETEALRRLPDETMRDLLDAELFKAVQPKRYGGFEVDLDDALRITAALGRGCGATAWVYGVLSDHQITLGMYPDAAQQDVWGETPDAVACSGLAPAGATRRVEGGYVLKGRWQFSSGSDHSAWIFVHSHVPPDGSDQGPRTAYYLVPREDFEIVDTWHVIGLAGTGSKDVVIEEAFVPEHRLLLLSDAGEGRTPGAEVNPGPLYRMPRMATTPFLLTAPTIGLTEGMLELFLESIRSKASRGVKLAELGTMQMRIAEAAAEVDAARLLLERDCAETMRVMRADGRLTLEQRARNRRDMAYAATLCSRAADRLFTATGANGLFDGNEMRRQFHDIRAVGAHFVNAWDVAGTTYTKVTLGLEPGPGPL
jgi:3-hydroxy-9,10-secoandrosta-1,3,5(10)-triene-9,17-dione monooxygenase